MTRNLPRVLLALTIFVLQSHALRAQQDDPAILTVDRVVGDEFEAETIDKVVWRKDSTAYYRLEQSREADGEDGGGKLLAKYDAATGAREVVAPSWRLVPPGDAAGAKIESFAWSRGGTRLLLSFDHKKIPGSQRELADYWVLDTMGWTWRKLGGDAAPRSLADARFSPDGSRVSYIKQGNIYIEQLTSDKISQLTLDGGDRLINGGGNFAMDSHLNYRYRELIEGRDGHAWSPDGKSIAYVQVDYRDVPDFTIINNTDTLQPGIIKFPYPKVGQNLPAYRVGVISADGGETRWLAVPGDPGNDYLWQMEWREQPGELMLQVLNRLQNTIKVMLADTGTGELKTILEESDGAWIEPNYIHWLDGGETFTWMSERDGWMRVYLYSRSGDQVRALTPEGADAVIIQGIDEKNGWLYYMASPGNPTQRYLYRAPISGRGDIERISPVDAPGTHRYFTSPDMAWAVHGYSTMDVAPVYDLVSLPGHETVKILEDNAELRSKLDKLSKRPSEFFAVDIDGGHQLDGYMIAPPDFDPQRKYPVLFYIYAEPGSQTVLDSWGGRQYIWHLMLAQQGYLVMSLDPRGTPAPKGRAWRKDIYRQVGTVAANDHAAATRRIIATRPYVDAAKIGIYGHSGGGQMSLNMIFKFPDLYALAMPSSSVTHQRFYNPRYQERLMGLIEDNPDGYNNGSPITWAHQLTGKLLIIHGSGDTNVHYQNFELLVDELVAHKKQFDMMVYPNRNHGLREGKNTRHHLYSLRTNFLHKNMPPGVP